MYLSGLCPALLAGDIEAAFQESQSGSLVVPRRSYHPHDFADDLRDPVCDVNVVARTNRVSGDGPLSSGGGVGVGNVVEVVRGRGGIGCGLRGAMVMFVYPI